MNIFEAIGWVTSVVVASALIGLVTSRLTAHWLRFERASIQQITVIGAILPAFVCFIRWEPLLSTHYVELNHAYLALVAALSALVIGSSVAFVMIAVSILKDIFTVMCAVVDRMFAKRN